MRSFAGIVSSDGSPPDERLLRCLGNILRLPSSAQPVLELHARCGIVRVVHREDAGGSRDEASVTDRYDELSFARWNEEKGELFAARDRFGVRPFYYARTEHAIVFSDSLEAVIAHPDVRAELLDDNAVADYLEDGVSNDAAATIYADVRRLPPAHLLRVRDGSLTIERYWTLPEPRRARRRDAVAWLESALKDAICDRVRGASAVVFMSGGLDSPALAALTREVRPKTCLLAMTSVYRTRIRDEEEPYAAEAARSIGIEHKTFPLDAYSPLHALDEGLWTADPGALLTASMTRDLYGSSAEHGPVALHGHPADAVLYADLSRHLDQLSLRRRAEGLIRYAWHRRRPPYFYFRGRRDVPACEHPLLSPIWSNYFEWAHPLFTRAPIELVYPWCDARVIEAALSLDPVPWLVDKYVLRELLRGRVSERVRRRRKTFLGGNPWQMPLPSEERMTIAAAARYVDPVIFRERCRADGFLADVPLRTVAFEYWLRELPRAVARLRGPALDPR